MHFRSTFALGLLASLGFIACSDESDPVDDASATSSSGTPSSSGSGASSAGGGGQGAAGGQGGAGPGVGGSGGDGGTGVGGGSAACHADPGPADKDRFVIVGHPYDTQGGPANEYQVLSLSSNGDLAATETFFTMGRPSDRNIVFTPDGELGFAVQDDGTIGVFSIDAAGAVTVVDSAFEGSFYATSLTMSADGTTLYVVDQNFPNNGGGVYRVSIACDGSLTDEGRLFESKSARAWLPLPGGDGLLAARGAFGSTGVAHAHRIGGDPPALVQSVDVFGDDDAILSWAALTHDGKFALIGDNSGFSGVPNRVGVVGITVGGIAATQVLPDIEDPYSIATSPFDDAALVASGFGDALFVLDYDPAAAEPFSLRGELEYVAGSPQLPGALAMVERGALEGRVFIADVRGLFVVEFQPGAVIEDFGIENLGDGIEDIVVGVGVQP